MKKELFATWTVFTAIALVLTLLLGIYVGGYFAFGELRMYDPENTRTRYFRNDWIVTAYAPMAWIESAITGRDVVTMVYPTTKPTLWPGGLRYHLQTTQQPSSTIRKPL